MKRELWERSTLPIVKGVMPKRKKRVTKAQLVAKFKKGDKSSMPKLDTEVREGADDIVEGVQYEITSVEEITTDVQTLKGIRVTVHTKKGEEGNVVLWERSITGTSSKLGVFITKLGNDTDKWLHKWIIFVTWQPRNRVLEVIPAPAPKASKPSTKKA